MDSIASLHSELKSVNKLFEEAVLAGDSQASIIPNLKKQITLKSNQKKEKTDELEKLKRLKAEKCASYWLLREKLEESQTKRDVMRSKFASIPSILRDTTAKFIDSSEKYKQECLKQVAYANEHNFFEEINELTSLAAERERMKLRRIEQMSARDMQLQEKELQRVLEDEEANLAFIYQCTDALRQNFQKKQEQQIFDIQLASLHRSASAASLTSASVPTVGEYPVRHTDFYESDVENTTRYSKPGRPVRFVPSNVDGQEQFIDVMNATSLTRTITEEVIDYGYNWNDGSNAISDQQPWYQGTKRKQSSSNSRFRSVREMFIIGTTPIE